MIPLIFFIGFYILIAWLFQNKCATIRNRAIDRQRIVLSFDIESMGLYGPGWAVGATLVDYNNKEIESIFHFCDPTVVDDPFKRLEWLKTNVIPHVTSNDTVSPDCSSPHEVRQKFWTFWRKCAIKYGDRMQMVGYANVPVEAKFLRDCVEDGKEVKEDRTFEGPFPFHELCTLMLSRGLPPNGTYPRKFPNENPVHHPLVDARHNARMWNDLLHNRSIL
jgi:hypothetical protein